MKAYVENARQSCEFYVEKFKLYLEERNDGRASSLIESILVAAAFAAGRGFGGKLDTDDELYTFNALQAAKLLQLLPEYVLSTGVDPAKHLARTRARLTRHVLYGLESASGDDVLKLGKALLRCVSLCEEERKQLLEALKSALASSSRNPKALDNLCAIITNRGDSLCPITLPFFVTTVADASVGSVENCKRLQRILVRT